MSKMISKLSKNGFEVENVKKISDLKICVEEED